jgi:sialidase-1
MRPQRRRIGAFLSVIAAFGLPFAAIAAQPFFEEHVVWKKHEDGMITFHVPTIFVSNRGTILAAADARFKDVGDFGPHHIAVKRSTDGGRTWGPNNYVAHSDGA